MFGNCNKDYVFDDKDDAANNNSNETIEKSKNSKLSSHSP